MHLAGLGFGHGHRQHREMMTRVLDNPGMHDSPLINAHRGNRQASINAVLGEDKEKWYTHWIPLDALPGRIRLEAKDLPYDFAHRYFHPSRKKSQTRENRRNAEDLMSLVNGGHRPKKPKDSNLLFRTRELFKDSVHKVADALTRDPSGDDTKIWMPAILSTGKLAHVKQDGSHQGHVTKLYTAPLASPIAGDDGKRYKDTHALQEHLFPWDSLPGYSYQHALKQGIAEESLLTARLRQKSTSKGEDPFWRINLGQFLSTYGDNYTLTEMEAAANANAAGDKAAYARQLTDGLQTMVATQLGRGIARTTQVFQDVMERADLLNSKRHEANRANQRWMKKAA